MDQVQSWGLGKRLDSLNKKKSIIRTPLNWDLNAFIFALKFQLMHLYFDYQSNLVSIDN
jgi:hypothetical protein